MYSVVFKTEYQGEVIEEGFDTSFSDKIEDALDLVKEELDLEQVDKIELTILPCKLEK
ncbi:MAG: hypothetical protein PQJ49_12140 [Sphaerochaetaceae bacterium]|nr:hypothetical protein [Sphaerochaetaceae bacterium]